jgi:hypothetical protein
MNAAIATVAAITHGFTLGFHAVMGAAAAAAAMLWSCSWAGDSIWRKHTAGVRGRSVVCLHIDAEPLHTDSKIGQRRHPAVDPWSGSANR